MVTGGLALKVIGVVFAVVSAGPRVTFARSGLTVNWPPPSHSLLELAEACDVPTRFSCRSEVCHVCVTAVLTGEVSYHPQPLQQQPRGSVLVCCSVPSSDVVLDL